MNVKLLFNVNPIKFVEVYNEVGYDYDKFINALKSKPNFQVINIMSTAELKELYILTVAKNKE